MIQTRGWLRVSLACLGFLITVIFWAYSAFSHYPHVMNVKTAALVITLVVLCPPSLLSLPFWETEPDTMPGIIIWAVIGLINAFLYGSIGALLAKRIWKQSERR